MQDSLIPALTAAISLVLLLAQVLAARLALISPGRAFAKKAQPLALF
jgi:hypothetical protein